MFKHILFPIDGSLASTRAVEKGAALATALGADVTLMTAVEQFPGGLMAGVYQAEHNPMHQAARDAGLHWLAAAQVILDAHGIQAKQLVMENRGVYQSILAAAEVSGADVIVMASHGAGALERLLLGSHTLRVLAHASIPVVVLR